MSWRHFAMLGVTATLAASALAVPTTDTAAASSPRSDHSRLLSVSAISADDVWAVGYVVEAGKELPLVEHFDGSSWTVVPTPDVRSRARLSSVSALAADDVWAAGTSDLIGGPDSIYTGLTLIEHWDGTAWSRVPSPNPSSNQNQLKAVHAVASDDVWAAGFRIADDEEPPITLTEHWDGTKWSWVKSGLDPGPVDRLVDIDASSGSDVWVAGSDPHTWVQRWTGDHFEEVSVPGEYALTGVAALSPTDSWVIGDSHALHWDGTAWSPVRNAGFGRSISAVTTSDIWIVGGHKTQHWNGLHWRRVKSPPVGSLLGVDARSSSDVWAVGYAESQPLIEHWDGERWSVVA